MSPNKKQEGGETLKKHEDVALLDVKGLSVHFKTDEGTLYAVDGVDFSMQPGEILGIVGESGCGKTMSALSLLRLVPAPGRIVSGEIFFEGINLLTLPKSAMVRIRGHKISMIFQDPMTSLNPVFTIGNQIEETILLHEKISKREARKRAIHMLELVKIPDAARRYHTYPHQLSGGLRQRAMIAMALACKPSLLIADEPTTALDVTIQAQILELLKELQSQFKTGIILITHNLGIVAKICDRVMVMYAGRVVEKADVKTLFKTPRHPYTLGLLRSIPRLDDSPAHRLIPIPGQLPTIYEKPSACTFVPRCFMAQDKCTHGEPDLLQTNKNHESRCYFFDRVNFGDTSGSVPSQHRDFGDTSGGVPKR